MPYVIDGNNLMGSWGTPGKAGGKDRRGDVVRRIAAFCRARGARAVLVFDGAPIREGLDEQTLGPLRLRFPGRGRDADTVIREIVDRAPRAGELTVVTSDKALYSYARTRGASVLRTHEWNALAGQPVTPRPGQPSGSEGEKPEREDDVEFWLGVFGREE